MATKIQLSQGAGGEHMDRLIKEHILEKFSKTTSSAIKVPLDALDDAAVVDNIVFSTDSHTIQPLIFPGGDIGSLAIAGTVNDVSVLGADPIALSSGFIVEEGFSFEIFDQIIQSMAKTSKKADVPIVTGDTKVIEHGAIQEFMINTSGIGIMGHALESNHDIVRQYRKTPTPWLVDSNIKDGDAIIISGNIGEHGIALLSYREGYGFDTKIKSDVAPVNTLIHQAMKTVGGIVSAKDPTRGGLSNTINEFSEKSNIGIIVEEEKIPIPDGVQAACDLLGYDPLEIGNEGKVVFGVIPDKAEEILQVIKKHELGKNAAIIGSATKKIKGVVLQTEIGGQRIIHKPLGDPIPRIC
jgi:hydrogenase expression/formation protein HypE